MKLSNKYNVIIIALTAIFLASCQGYRSPDNDIIFYRTNVQSQQVKLTLVPNTDEPGCHNLLVNSSVHRVAVIGFDYCQVFAEKDCQADSILQGSWLNKKTAKKEDRDVLTDFTMGTRWVLDEAGNTEARSWNCVSN